MTSQSTSSSSTATSNATTNDSSSPVTTPSNLPHLTTLKLTKDNYLLWMTQARNACLRLQGEIEIVYRKSQKDFFTFYVLKVLFNLLNAITNRFLVGWNISSFFYGWCNFINNSALLIFLIITLTISKCFDLFYPLPIKTIIENYSHKNNYILQEYDSERCRWMSVRGPIRFM